MISSLARTFPHTIYNAKNLEFTRFAKVGAATIGLGTLVSAALTDDQKKEMASLWTAFQKTIIDPKHVTDQDLLDTTLMSWRGARNVIESSPVFYGLYQLIHNPGNTAKLPLKHHINVSILRGFNGSLAATPILAGFYATASIAIPYFQEVYEEKSMSKKDANELAITTAFLLAGPLEFLLEGLGSGVKFGTQPLGALALGVSVLQGKSPGTLVQGRWKELSVGLGVAATVLLTGRLATGALTQFKATGENDANDKLREARDFVITVAGTTLTQHPINGVMQTLTKQHGWKGLWSYLAKGNTSGTGNYKGAMAQFGKTFGQRFIYTALWNSLSHRKEESPPWAIAPSTPTKVA